MEVPLSLDPKVAFFLDPILDNLKEAIRKWEPAVYTHERAKARKKKKSERDLRLTRNMLEIAEKLKVSDKTVSNWVNSPIDHPITMRRFFEICVLLGTNPNELCPDCPRFRFMSKISDPVEAESMLLDLEKGISGGGTKLVVFPLWSSPLFLDPLNRLYASKGFYRRIFPEGSRPETPSLGEGARETDFFRLRKQRRDHFEGGNYTIRSIFMRDELDNYLNRRRLFKRCGNDEIAAQLQHLLDMLDRKTWNQQPLLDMRLTKSHFRNQYGIFFPPKGEPTLVLNTNTGYLVVQKDSDNTLAALKNEFDKIWEDGTYKGLQDAGIWRSFLSILVGKVNERAENEKGKRSEEDRRKGPRDRRASVDLDGILMSDVRASLDFPIAGKSE